MVKRGHFIWTGTVFRRALLDRIGSLDPQLDLLSDADFLFRAAAAGPYATVVEPGAIFAWHPQSPSSLPRLTQFWPGWVRMAEKLAANPDLAPAQARLISQRLEAKLVGKLPLIGLFSASRGLEEDGFQTALLLRDRYHRIPEAGLVWAATWLAGRFAPVRLLLSWLAEHARWPRTRRIRALQRQFDREYREIFQIDLRTRKDLAA